ncbi:MAG: hypothetical protein WB791_05220, partial [Waddliaceae bacterium]
LNREQNCLTISSLDTGASFVEKFGTILPNPPKSSYAKHSKAHAIIDYGSYFKLLEEPVPTSQATILQKLCADQLTLQNEFGDYSITNLGGVLFANDFAQAIWPETKSIASDQIQGNKSSRSGERALLFEGLWRDL